MTEESAARMAAFLRLRAKSALMALRLSGMAHPVK
jgi:hypothetical protein